MRCAEGIIDALIERNIKLWDIAAIIPIIKASGGIITTWDNKDASLGGNIIVSNNLSNHKKILKLLKPAT